jgi:Fe-S oxidoreductase
MVLTLEDYRYDADRCVRCGGCKWVDHIYMDHPRWGVKCPSSARYLFDAYAAYGRLYLGLGLIDGELELSPTFVDSLYRCTQCGACDVGCKRNLDLEPLLTLEALRQRCVQEGKGPMPEHKAIAENIVRNRNRYNAPPENRFKWLPEDVPAAKKAEYVYFVGCNSAYRQTELAQATVKILKAAGVEFMVMDSDEWCCGHPLYVTGQADLAKVQAEHNIEAIERTGASTVVTSCAECYKTIKVDYPKMLKKSSADMSFGVVHLVELVDQLIKEERLKLTNPVDMRIVYHDPCNLSRMSEPWLHWEGKRVEYGKLEPSKEYRRGTQGVYQPPRDILSAIPGVELIEFIRKRENALCCGAGGGVRDAFRDFALWTADERLEEAKAVGAEAVVSCCPYCKENFIEAANNRKDKMKIYDITDVILQAIQP